MEQFMELEQQIKEFVAAQISPALQSHGGDVEFVQYVPSDKAVYVKYVGACAHCPSSSMATHNAIESMLVEQFPGQVVGIERV